MRQRTPFVLVFLAACTAAATRPVSTASDPIVMVDATGPVVHTQSSGITAQFNASPDSVFKALIAAYDELGMSGAVVDPSQRLVKRSNMAIARTFAGAGVASLFDCGSGISGPYAERGRIDMTVTSMVTPAGDAPSVTTTVEATVMPSDGTAAGRQRCVSRGGIEERIRRSIARSLGLSSGTR
jgi:hypothetical protein